MLSAPVRSSRVWFTVLAVLLGWCASFATAEEAAAAIDFDRDVAPLLVKNCLGCHNGSRSNGGLNLDTREHALAGGESGPVLVPGKPDESFLIARVTDGSMPPEGKGTRLSAAEVQTLRGWVERNSPWPAERRLSLYEFTTSQRAGRDWWSLQPIQRPDVPKLETRDQPSNPIDALLRVKLRASGLDFAPPADRLTLIRRATFDLTGLPPTPEEVDAFIADTASDAYARLVDRLLASPRYGERWAQHWLDVVRFSESKGFERDRLRDNAWRYRDWVIGALNADLPYDQFLRRQIAGDAIAVDDPQGSVPTGFLVTGPNNDVGNGSELERKRERADELDDFVTNTTSAMLGLSVGCARCHDHKFDPIPTRDYYRLVAVFAGVFYGDRPLASDAQQAARAEQLAEIDQQLDQAKQQTATCDRQIARLTGGTASPVSNEVEFPVTEGRFVRMAIETTVDGAEAGIDELEVFGPDGAQNLAHVAAGGKATASSLLPGHAIHQVAHLNNGLYGNDQSWIAGARGKAWVQIELQQPSRINRVVWGRDRDKRFVDRVPGEYTIQVSPDEQSWTEVARRPTAANLTPEADAELAKFRDDRKRLAEEQQALEQRREAIPAFATTWAPISKPPEVTHLFKRGDVTTPAEVVTPGALSAVPALSPDLGSPAAGDRERRTALADWIGSSRNPLTARVMANRLWQHHFGAGLVENPSDFGFHGGQPSHPELLDWLASDLIEHGWSLKHLHRQIMLAAAYQQSGRATPGAAAADEDNRLLWRMNRKRLEAEEIRDAMLYTAGSLDLTAGGPSFHTFKYTDGNIPIFEPLEGDGRATWRRTVYRHVVRSHSVPFLDVFDCPDSSVMTAKRSRTTTPLQALSLLNNSFVMEHSRLLAARVRGDVGDDVENQVRRATWLVFNRPASDAEVQDMAAFVRQEGLARLGRVLWNANEFLYVE